MAPACHAALGQATAAWPARDCSADALHDASHIWAQDDHPAGNAFDLTHDPAHGCDAHALAAALAARPDPRVKCIISRGRIWSHARAGEGWRRYWGPARYRKQVHVAIYADCRQATEPWWQ